MHIYHYAPYEPTHLLAMAARHGVREADVDRLLRDGVFVDLYPIVRRACASARGRTRSRSSSRCTWATRCARATCRRATTRSSATSRRARSRDDGQRRGGAARSSTTSPTTTATTASRPGGCATGSSTVRARRGCARRRTRSRARRLRAVGRARSPSSSLAQQHPEDSAEAQALRLGAAAIDYYPREAKTFWATHFLRLREPVSLWEETRDVVGARPRALPRRRGLALPRERPRRRAPHPRAARRAGAGHPAERGVRARSRCTTCRRRIPFEASPRWIHADHSVTVSRCSTTARSSRRPPSTACTWTELPIALTPAPPPRALNQQVGDRRVGGCRHRGRAGAARGPGHRHPAPASAAHARSGGLPRIHRRRRRRHRARRRRPRPQLPRRAGPAGHGQDVCRVARDRTAGAASAASRSASSRSRTRSSRTCSTGSSRPASRASSSAKAPKDPAAADLSFTADHQERRRRRSPPSTPRGLRRRRHGVGLQPRGPHPARQPRPARDRRGRPVLARLDDRRVARVAAAAAARRPAAAAAGEPGHASRAGRHVRARLGHGRRRRHPARLRLLPRPHLAHASGGRRRRSRACRTAASSPRTRRPRCATSRASSPGVHPIAVRHRGNATQSLEEAAVVVDIVRDLIGRDVVRHPHRRRRRDDAACRRARSRSATSSS